MAALDKQPQSIYLLFFTELWERFGFYTVQTILVLYMSSQLHFSDKLSYLFYGTYSAMMYLTPAVGGWLADKYLGFQRSIILGGILFTLGYLMCAIPSKNALFYALSILIIANGFFKPNVSSIVGELYDDPNDHRREGGFTLFYMGINIGSLIPPIFAGALVTHYGWHYGFIIAALGMIFGMIIFIKGKKILNQHGEIPNNSPLLTGKINKFKIDAMIFLFIILAVLFFRMTFTHPALTNLIVILVSCVILLFVFYLILKLPSHSRNKMIAALVLIVISIGFWALYNQTFTSLMLFAERNMDPNFLGFHIDAEFTQFFNPFFIIAFSPVLSRAWLKLGKANLNPSIPTKFAVGVIMMTLGFAVLALGCHLGHHGITSAWWLVLSYMFQTIGELFLSPIGLSMITVLSARNMVGLMMGVWFLAQSASFAIGGMLATIADVPKQYTASQSLPIYAHAYLVLAKLSVILMIVSLLLIPVLKRLINKNTKLSNQAEGQLQICK